MKRVQLPKLQIKKQVRFWEEDANKLGQKFGIYWLDPKKDAVHFQVGFDAPDAPSATVVEVESTCYQALKYIEGVILLFNSIVTPLVLAYGLMGGPYFALDLVSAILDGVYFVLMLFKFRTCYIDQQGIQQHNPRKIFLYYLTGWFFLDLVSIFPSDQVSNHLFDLSIIRVVNLCFGYHMTPFWFINPLCSFFNRLVEDFWSKFRRIFNYLIMLHVLNCCWIFMNRLEGDNPRSWKNRYAPNCEPYDLYLETLYFVLMTASTVGFGDMVPDTIAEYILTILLMNFGTTTYSLICGSIINAIRDETTKAMAKREKKNFIRRLTDGLEIQEELKERLLKNIEIVIDQDGVNEEREFLKKLPIQLRSLLSHHLHHEWIDSVPYFRDKDRHFVGQLCLYLTEVQIQQGAELFGENEKPQIIYFLKSGSVQLKLNEGTLTEKLNWHVYGEIDFILLDKRRFQFVAIEHVTMLRLHRDDYDRIFNYLFPQEGLKLIKSAKNKFATIDNPNDEMMELDEPPSGMAHGFGSGQPFLRLVQVKKQLERVEKGVQSLIQAFQPNRS